MDKRLYREKNIERVSSPDQLNEYMRVTNPGVWLILGAVILLLAGFCVWGIYGHMDSLTKGAVRVDETGAVCYVTEKVRDKLSEGMSLQVNGHEATVTAIGEKPVQIKDDYLIHLGEFAEGAWLYELTLKTDVPQGEYAVELVTGSISPMTFVMN